MPENDNISNNQAIEKLLKAKFGRLYEWVKPDIQKTVGPYAPEVFDQFEARRLELIENCRVFLTEIAPTDLAILYHSASDDPHEKRQAWESFLELEINELTRQVPSWLAGGFGHPDYVADFDYWGKMENYTLHESLLLSVGVEPKHFDEKRLARYIKEVDQKSYYPAIEFLIMRHEIFLRKFSSSYYGLGRVPPEFLAEWFAEINLPVHPDFARVIQERARMKSGHEERGAGSNHTEDKPVLTDKREVEKIAQLFTAMAIDQLGYDPTAKRSPITKEIADLAAEMGLKISDDTVRKYLKLGAKQIPEDWKPK
jgi:hypothetical protein